MTPSEYQDMLAMIPVFRENYRSLLEKGMNPRVGMRNKWLSSDVFLTWDGMGGNPGLFLLRGIRGWNSRKIAQAAVWYFLEEANKIVKAHAGGSPK
ncbi:MAG: hypothetical protein WC551_10185 [Patescibacteria group bacterium]